MKDRRTHRFTCSATALALAALAIPAWADVPVEISSCQGASVPAHRIGVVTADLQCGYHCLSDPSLACAINDDAACAGEGPEDCVADVIQVGRDATLKLQGHVITGPYNSDAIRCVDAQPGGTCTVAGPGEIDSTKGSAVSSVSMNVRVRDLGLYGSYGAIDTPRTADVRGCTFGNWDGDVGGRRVRVVDSTSEGDGGGFFATESVSLVRVATGSSVHAGRRITGRNVTLVGGFTCPRLDAPRVRVSGLVEQGCPP